MSLKKEIIFGSILSDDGVPIVFIGMSDKATDYISRNGTFLYDLTQQSIPVRLVIFGEATRESARQTLHKLAQEVGARFVDITDLKQTEQ